MSMDNLDNNANPSLTCPEGTGRTKQSFEKDCNINNILAKYKRTGQLSHISAALGQYRDISGIPDLHSAINMVADAESAFEQLPAEVRALCGHSAGNFLDFLDDPNNKDLCEDLGLLEVPSRDYVPTPPNPAENTTASPEETPPPPDAP